MSLVSLLPILFVSNKCFINTNRCFINTTREDITPLGKNLNYIETEEIWFNGDEKKKKKNQEKDRDRFLQSQVNQNNKKKIKLNKSVDFKKSLNRRVNQPSTKRNVC